MATPIPGGNPDDASFRYDEFSYFEENCSEYGLELGDPPQVERVGFELSSGRRLSALRWGTGPVEAVFVHGGAQNAHTWDTVALALRPTAILAIDLPGHGRSQWRTDGAYDPRSSAQDLAEMIAAVAPDARLLVGMSLGGITANAVMARHRGSFERAVIIDVTPGVNRDKAAEVHAFIEGPQTFASFREIFDRTVEYNPTRSPESLRRGILHNAHRLDSGEWEWNYDRTRMVEPPAGDTAGDQSADGAQEQEYLVPDDLWADVAALDAPYLLLRGALSPVVDDDDVAELLRLRPDARVRVVEDAGHSIQGDRPIELASILRAELDELS